MSRVSTQSVLDEVYGAGGGSSVDDILGEVYGSATPNVASATRGVALPSVPSNISSPLGAMSYMGGVVNAVSPTQANPPADTWAGRYFAGYANTLADFPSDLVRAGQAAVDFIQTPSNEANAPTVDLRGTMNSLASIVDQGTAMTKQAAGVPGVRPGGIPEAIGSGAANLGTQVLLGAATGGSSLPMQAAGFAVGGAAPVLGQTMRDASNELGAGQEGKAANEAVAAAGVTAVTSFFPGMAILRRVPGGDKAAAKLLAWGERTAARRLTGAGLAEGGQEFVEGAIQDILTENQRRGKPVTRDMVVAALTDPQRAMDFALGAGLGGVARVPFEVGGQNAGNQNNPVRQNQNVPGAGGPLPTGGPAPTAASPTVENQEVSQPLQQSPVASPAPQTDPELMTEEELGAALAGLDAGSTQNPEPQTAVPSEPTSQNPAVESTASVVTPEQRRRDAASSFPTSSGNTDQTTSFQRTQNNVAGVQNPTGVPSAYNAPNESGSEQRGLDANGQQYNRDGRPVAYTTDTSPNASRQAVAPQTLPETARNADMSREQPLEQPPASGEQNYARSVVTRENDQQPNNAALRNTQTSSALGERVGSSTPSGAGISIVGDSSPNSTPDLAELSKRSGAAVTLADSAKLTDTERSVTKRLGSLGRSVVWVDTAGPARGAVVGRTPTTIYLRRGMGNVRLAPIALHEVMHSARRTNPELASQLVDTFGRDKVLARGREELGLQAEAGVDVAGSEDAAIDEGLAGLLEDAANENADLRQRIIETPGLLDRLRVWLKQTLANLAGKGSQEVRHAMKLLDQLEAQARKESNSRAEKSIEWARSQSGVKRKIEDAYNSGSASALQGEYDRLENMNNSFMEDNSGQSDYSPTQLFSFPEGIPEGVKNSVSPRELISYGFRTNVKNAKGEEAFNTLGAARYWEIVKAAKQLSQRSERTNALRKAQEPEARFVAAYSDLLGGKPPTKPKAAARVSELQGGDIIRIEGQASRVIEDENGKSLMGGAFDGLSVDGMDAIPVDAGARGWWRVDSGTAEPADAPKEQAADIPFSARKIPDTINVDGTQRSTLNSDGKPIAPNEEAIRNFWRWFGDSKAVDADGRPLVVYHGTPDGRFIQSTGTFQTLQQRMGMAKDGAFWFATSQSTARTYANPHRAFDYQNSEPMVVDAYIKLENPLIVEAGGKEWREAQARGKTTDVIEQAHKAGHDGAIVRNVKDDYNNSKGTRTTTTFTVWQSAQIKSATENKGTFSKDNPDIRFSARKLELRSDQQQGMLNFTSGWAAPKQSKEPPLSAKEKAELYPGIRAGETVKQYEKRMGTADTPIMFDNNDSKKPASIRGFRDGLKIYMKGRGGALGNVDADAKREWLREFGRPASDTGRKLRYEYELSDGRVVSAENALKYTNPKAYESLQRRVQSLTSDKGRYEVFKLMPEDVKSAMFDDMPIREAVEQSSGKNRLGDAAQKLDAMLRENAHPLAGLMQWREINQEVLSRIDAEISKSARIVDGGDLNEVNRRYNATRRPIDGSYVVTNDRGELARVDGGDTDDVAWYKERGFVKRERTADTPVMFSAKLPDTIDVDGKRRPTTNSDGKPIARTAEEVRNFWRWFADSRVVDKDGKPLVVYHGTSEGGFNTFDPDFGVDLNRHFVGGVYASNDPQVAATYAGKEQSGESLYPVYMRLVDPRIKNFKGSNWNEYKKKIEGKWRISDAEGNHVKGEFGSKQEAMDWLNELEDEDTTGFKFIQDDGRVATLTTRKIAERAFLDEKDGVVFHNIVDDGKYHTGKTSTVFVAFGKDSIKSATGNRGTFDASEADIRFSAGKQSNFAKENARDATTITKLSRQATEATQNLEAEKAKTKAIDSANRMRANMEVRIAKVAMREAARLKDRTAQVIEKKAAEVVTLSQKREAERQAAKQTIADLKNSARSLLGLLAKGDKAYNASQAKLSDADAKNWITGQKAKWTAEATDQLRKAVHTLIRKDSESAKTILSKLTQAKTPGEIYNLAREVERYAAFDDARRLQRRLVGFLGVGDITRLSDAKVRDKIVTKGALEVLSGLDGQRDEAKYAMSTIIDLGAEFDRLYRADEPAAGLRQTLDEMNAMFSRLMQLKHEAKLADKIVKNGRLSNVYDTVKVDEPAIKSAPVRLVGKFGRHARSLKPWLTRQVLNVPTLVRVVTGGKGAIHQTITEGLAKGTSDAFNIKRKAFAEADAAAKAAGYVDLRDALAKISGSLGEASQKTITLSTPLNGTTEISLDQAMKIAAIDPETLDDMLTRDRRFNWSTNLGGNGDTLTWDTYSEIRDKVGPEHLKLIDTLKDIRDDRFEPMARVVKALTGVEPPKVIGYEPRRVNQEYLKAKRGGEPNANMSATTFTNSMLQNMGLTKARESKAAPLVMHGFLQDWVASIDEVSRITAMAETVHNAHTMLRVESVKNAIDERWGTEVLNDIHRRIDTVAGVEATDQRMKKVTRVVKFLSRNVGRSLTAVNVKSWLRTSGGVFPLAADMPRAWFVRGVKDAFTTKGLWDEALANSPILDEQFGQSPVGLAGAGEAMTGLQPKATAQSVGRSAAALGKSVKSAAVNAANFRVDTFADIRDIFDKGLPNLMDHIRVLNFFASLPARIAYAGNKARYGGDIQRAVRETERVIRETQGMNDPLYRSGWQHTIMGGPLAPLAMFSNDGSRMLNQLVNAKLDGKPGKVIAAILLNSAWGGLIVAGLSKAMINALLNDDDDEANTEQALRDGAFTAVRDTAGLVPGADRLVETVWAAVDKGRRGSPSDAALSTPVGSLLSDTVDATTKLFGDGVTALGDDAKAQRAEDRFWKNLESLGLNASSVAGVPLAPGYRLVKNVAGAAAK